MKTENLTWRMFVVRHIIGTIMIIPVLFQILLFWIATPFVRKELEIQIDERYGIGKVLVLQGFQVYRELSDIFREIGLENDPEETFFKD